MSISAINWAFYQKTGSPASKLVLIKLADNANDEGRCYPSLAYIAKHCEMHRSTVIRHISALSERGFVDIEHRSVEGSKIPNVYHLKMQPLVAECDQGSRTEQLGVVAACDQGSRTLRHRIVIEPSVEPSLNLKHAAASDGVNVCAMPDKPTRSKPPAVSLDYSAWPEQPSESVLTDWIAARKAKKLPVNQTVITRLGNELTRAVSAGLRVDDCLAEAVTRGWQGFKSEWMTNNRGDQHENRRSNSNGFNAIDPNDESWLTDDALAYIESGREIGNRVRAGKPLLRRDDDGVYRLATGDDG